MFDAADKYRVEITNRGTESIVVEHVLTGEPTRVAGVPQPTRLEPGGVMTLIGYEPGTGLRVKPADRLGPVGMLDPVLMEQGKPGIIERATQDIASLGQRPEDFDVDLHSRKVFHRATGIWFYFREHASDAEWQSDDSVAFHDNPRYHGSRRQLAENAKRAAVAAGMTHRKEERP